MTPRPCLARLLCLLAGAALAGAATPADPPRHLPLGPSTARIGFRAYALGILPIDGAFSRFEGTLALDGDAGPELGCRITLRIEVASLELADPDIRADMLSPNLLDAARYPALAFEGACHGPAIVGILTLHGVSRPLALAVTRREDKMVAEGSLLRTEWGITGRPLLAGRTVRLQVTLPVPR